MKLVNLQQQKPARVAAKNGQLAEGVTARALPDEQIGNVLERLFEIAPGGSIGSNGASNKHKRQFFVLQGIGEIGDTPGEGEVLGAGTVVSVEAGEAYTIRNISDAPLLLIYLVEQEAAAANHEVASTTPASKQEALIAAADGKVAHLRPDIRKVMIYFDGGDPGGNQHEGTVSYGSYGIFIPNNKGEFKERKADEVVRHEFEAGMTNNEAEYLTLIRGLEGIIARIEALGQSPGDWHIDIKGDSNLVVNQVNGDWRAKAEHLKPYIYQARELLSQFGSHTLTWHDRSNSVRVLGH